jgi:hypothetical protein
LIEMVNKALVFFPGMGVTASQATKAPSARVSILAGTTRVPKRLIALSCWTVMNSSASVR